MTAHNCTTFDPSCYRCELGRDEMTAPESRDSATHPTTPTPTRSAVPGAAEGQETAAGGASEMGRTPSPDEDADFPTCGRCGAYPVRGFASVWRGDEQVWLCHGDDDPSPTCYEQGPAL